MDSFHVFKIDIEITCLRQDLEGNDEAGKWGMDARAAGALKNHGPEYGPLIG